MPCYRVRRRIVRPDGFEGYLKMTFQPHLMNREVFDWNILFNFIRKEHEFIFYESSLRKFLKFSLELLENYKCHNVSIFIKLVSIYRELHTLYKDFYCQTFLISSRLRERENWMSRTKIIYRILRKLNYKYSLCPGVDFARVVETIDLGDINSMKVLIKYGLCYLPPDDCFKEIFEENCLDTFLFDLGISRTTLDFISGGELENVCRWRNLIKNCIGSWKGGIRRSVLVFMAIKVLLFKQSPKDALKYAKCFRLFNWTIPEPLVTFYEMQDFFTVTLRSLDPGGVVQGYMEKLSEMYPESLTACYQPRTLFDLCCIKIRAEAVKCGKTVPVAVSQLKIPGSLKKYVAGNKWISNVV